MLNNSIQEKLYLNREVDWIYLRTSDIKPEFCSNERELLPCKNICKSSGSLRCLIKSGRRSTSKDNKEDTINVRHCWYFISMADQEHRSHHQ